jgi:hypothetical protein
VRASMLVETTHCCLCGMRFVGRMKRRIQTRGEIAALVTSRCWPTPFLFKTLSCPLTNAQAAVKQAVCIPCVNWKRRIAQVRNVRRKRIQMLQLDQLICYLMRPGVYQEPDRRCIARLLAAARQPDNPFRFVFPVPVQTMLSTISSNTIAACLQAWWDYNGNTEFFSSGKEAKRIRSLLYHMGA